MIDLDLKFDRYQFDPECGTRRAGTLMNNALPAHFYGRCMSDELLAWETFRTAVTKLKENEYETN